MNTSADTDDSITFSPVGDHSIIVDNDGLFQNDGDLNFRSNVHHQQRQQQEDEWELGRNSTDTTTTTSSIRRGVGTNPSGTTATATGSSSVERTTMDRNSSFDSSISISGSSNKAGVSLLERIQQSKQKNQANTEMNSFQPSGLNNNTTHGNDSANSSANAFAVSSSPPSLASQDIMDQELLVEEEEENDGEFGYNVYNGTRYAHVPTTNSQSNGNFQIMNIPDYASSTNRRGPYSSTEGNETRGEQILSALSHVGNTVGSAAKSAFYGAKRSVYTYLTRNNLSRGLTSSSQRMHEMDYQRESLLMDPHEVEDGIRIPMDHASPMGLRGMEGMIASDTALTTTRRSHFVLGCVKQFCVDVMDIFWGLSRNMKLAVVAFLAFLIWLFISEEWQHGKR